jgi:uncharacterized membrane protein
MIREIRVQLPVVCRHAPEHDPRGNAARILLSQRAAADGIVAPISTDLPTMDWYYVSQGQPAGPIPEEQLAELLRNGTVTAATLVWRNGLANWIPLSEAQPGWMNPPTPTSVPEIPPVPSTPQPSTTEPVAGPTPASGPSDAPPSNPQPAAPQASAPHDDSVSEEELLATDYPVDLVEPFRRGWQTFTRNPGILLGTGALVWLLMMAGSSIPILGALVQIALYGPLLGGLYVVYLRKIRGRDADVGLIFSAFGPRFFQHLMAYLAMFAANLLIFLPVIGIVLFLVFGSSMAGAQGSRPQDFDQVVSGIGAVALVLGGLCLLVCIAASWIVGMLWLFAIPLVADKGYDFWPALELSRKRVLRHLGWHLVFSLLIGVAGLVGFLACCVGLLVTLPVSLCALLHWYENLFGKLRPKSVTATS